MSPELTLTFAGDESGDVSINFGKGATPAAKQKRLIVLQEK
jgi:hypothetical protein